MKTILSKRGGKKPGRSADEKQRETEEEEMRMNWEICRVCLWIIYHVVKILHLPQENVFI